jgi:hypothetical protein
MRRLILTLLLWPVALTGCTYHIRPSACLRDPVSVFVADYGYHSTLLLPRADGSVMEYAYGERDWFALNRDQWYRVGVVLLWPTPAVLGRRELPGPPEFDALKHQTQPEALHEAPVERDAAARLMHRLDADFDAGRDQLIENPLVGLSFVPYTPSYCITSQCNSRVADWLREMGCRVTGAALNADFKVLPAGP